MKKLVFAKNNNAFTDSLAIAEGIGLDHKVVIRLIRKYESDFSELGRVNFESSPFETNGGIQERDIAILNEDYSLTHLGEQKTGSGACSLACAM